MALHNSVIGVWRHDNSPWRARCHVSIRQSPSLCNAILNTCPCLLAILFNQTISMVSLGLNVKELKQIQHHKQCGKLNFWSTRPKTDLSYMFYTKFYLPRPIFYSPSSKCTPTGEWTSVNSPHWYRLILDNIRLLLGDKFPAWLRIVLMCNKPHH